MSRTKRTIPHWATQERQDEIAEFVERVSNAPSQWSRPERDPFFHGFDKLGRKTPIGDPETREEVWGENNKQELRTRLAHKVRRDGKTTIREELKDE